MLRTLIGAVVMSLVATPAVADAAQSPAKEGKPGLVVNGKSDDRELTGSADRIICRVQDETGSRIGAKRVCARASEWAQQRRDEREIVDKIQTLNTKNF